MIKNVDIDSSVTHSDVEAIDRIIGNFPSARVRTLFRRDNVKLEDVETVPRRFTKYFAVMRHLAGGSLEGKTLLDVGSGLGAFVAQARLLGINSKGIDVFSEYQGTCHAGALCVFEAYGHSREVAQRAFAHHDISKAPLSDQTYDFVTSFGMLEHIYERDARQMIIRNMMKSLAPGGSLILTCGPNAYFPFDLHHYGPKFFVYHCLPLWARVLYLRAFAAEGQCRDPKWLNGMKVREIRDQILCAERGAEFAKCFPLWVRLASTKWMRIVGARELATGAALLLSALNAEPVIILVATKPVA